MDEKQKYEQFKGDLDALVQKYNDLSYQLRYDIIQDYADQMQDVLETMYHCQTNLT